MAHQYLLEKFDGGMHYIMVDDGVVNEFVTPENNRVICKLNDEVAFHCAILPKKEGGYYINIASAICKS